MKCAAKISGALGDWDHIESFPKQFHTSLDLWRAAPSKKTGKKILEFLEPFLKANFCPENFDNPEEILERPNETDALEVMLSGFEYDDEILPAINATAIFDIKFKKGVGDKEIESWCEENDEDFAFAVNFFWEIGDENIYLDTHGGIEFWTAEN